jgi:AcrR family transcriptional regulator
MSPRGRPRNEACGHNILVAALELVAQVGIAGLTMDSLAERAGVGKATIYRRWSSKEALMLDAWMAAVATPEVPDTGTLRGDVLTLFGSFSDSDLAPDMMQRVFPQMIAAARTNPDVADAYRTFVEERRRPLREVLVRAAARGELPAGLDVELVQDLLVSPLMYRWLVIGSAMAPGELEQSVDLVLAGVHARVQLGV